MARTAAGRRREQAGDIKLSITPSGKVIWRDKYPSEYKGWSAGDHLYAAIIHEANRTQGGDIAREHRVLASTSREISPADIAEAHRTGRALAGLSPADIAEAHRTGRALAARGKTHHATKKSPAQLQREIDDALSSPGGTSGAGKATIVTKQPNGSLKAIQVPISKLVSTMADLGFEHTGYNNNSRQRAELQGAPKFRGVNGPMWGGSESEPLRYETPEAYRDLSR